MQSPEKSEALPPELPEKIAYSVADLHARLPFGLTSCYEIARAIGRRHGKKLVVMHRDLVTWLASRPTARAAPWRRPGRLASGGAP